MTPPPAAAREHVARGARIQMLLRLALVVFLAAVLLSEPPARHGAACWSIVVAYLVLLAAPVWCRRPARPGASLAFDVVLLTALTLVSDTSAAVSWTPYLVINGFFLLPVIAAAQLDPRRCTLTVVPVVAAYLGSGLATAGAGDEPVSYVVLRAFVLASTGVGAVLLSRLQRDRVLTIRRLLDERTTLLADLTALERRERRDLAESLHDGALQYVLAACQELGELVEHDGSPGVDRADAALRHATALLRGTLGQLHPAVLDAAGLVPAMRDLAATAGRGRVVVELDTRSWPVGDRTVVDDLLLATARELIVNVVKHARASTARVTLERRDGVAVLRVADDGCGMPAHVDLAALVRSGHLGLATRRLRVAASGGELIVRPVVPRGTVVEVRVPLVDGASADRGIAASAGEPGDRRRGWGRAAPEA
jgi:two-component system NarL family sensor kinase